VSLSGTIYCDLSRVASGSGTASDPYNPTNLSSVLSTETTLEGDVVIALYNTLQVTDGSLVDWSTPLLVNDNGYKIVFTHLVNQEKPKIYSEDGGYSTRSLVLIGGGTADTVFADVIVHVRGDLNYRLEGCLEVIGGNDVIVSNVALIANEAERFLTGQFCNPGCIPGCQPGCSHGEGGYTPILSTNINVSVHSCTFVIHSAAEELMDLPVVNALQAFTNCLYILGNVAYPALIETNASTRAEGNHFYKIESTPVSVIDKYLTDPLTPENQPDVGDFDDVHGLVNVIGNLDDLDLEYDPDEGVGKGLANILNTFNFDDNYYLFSTYTNEVGNAGYNFDTLDFPIEFVGAPVTGKSPHTVQFTNMTIVPVKYSNVEWDWDFGDGETSNEESPQHTYNGYGYFTVTLKARAFI